MASPTHQPTSEQVIMCNMLITCGEQHSLAGYLKSILELVRQEMQLARVAGCGVPCMLPSKRGRCCARCRINQTIMQRVYHDKDLCHRKALLMRLAFDVLFKLINIRDIVNGTWVKPSPNGRDPKHKGAVVWLCERVIWTEMRQLNVRKGKPNRWYITYKRIEGRGELGWLPLRDGARDGQMPKDTYKKVDSV
jgi:hypothetical protein